MTADFSQLTAARNQKKKVMKRDMDKDSEGLTQTETKVKSGRISSPESKEKYIDSIVTRIQEEEASNDVKNRRFSALSRSRDSDSEELSSLCSSYKSSRNKKDKKMNADRTVKKPIKSKKKKQIPISVTKEEAEKEMSYSREDWLKMDPAALGERCLAHLMELKQQRSCSNISGRRRAHERK